MLDEKAKSRNRLSEETNLQQRDTDTWEIKEFKVKCQVTLVQK